MEEDNTTGYYGWMKSLDDAVQEHTRGKLKDKIRGMLSTNGGIGSFTKNPYLVAVDPYDAPVEEEKPEPIDMTQYIHKDEMVQILLDSRHALFNDRIPSVLEVIEWIEERKKQQL